MAHRSIALVAFLFCTTPHAALGDLLGRVESFLGKTPSTPLLYSQHRRTDHTDTHMLGFDPSPSPPQTRVTSDTDLRPQTRVKDSCMRVPFSVLQHTNTLVLTKQGHQVQLIVW